MRMSLWKMLAERLELASKLNLRLFFIRQPWDRGSANLI